MLDRLVGYLVTQELRRVMGKPTSAGRVQSPAVYLVVLREREIRNFQAVNHFGVRLYFSDTAGERYWHADWQPVPDFANEEFPYVQDRHLAQFVADIRNVVIQSCEDRKSERHPPAPFISSTLQQAASNALKWDPDKTMQVAQRLYEQGVITYHRTDNPNVLEGDLEGIRSVACTLGVNTVDGRRPFKAAEGAQEAHSDILKLSQTQFGDHARRRYQALILAVLQAIADTPYRIGSHDRDELAPGLRSYHLIFSCQQARHPRGMVKSPRHIMFYRVASDDVIEVVRLLHDAMEV